MAPSKMISDAKDSEKSRKIKIDYCLLDLEGSLWSWYADYWEISGDFGGLRNDWWYEEVEVVNIDNYLEKFGSADRGRFEIQGRFFFFNI